MLTEEFHIVQNLLPFLEASAAVKDRKWWISESGAPWSPERRAAAGAASFQHQQRLSSLFTTPTLQFGNIFRCIEIIFDFSIILKLCLVQLAFSNMWLSAAELWFDSPRFITVCLWSQRHYCLHLYLQATNHIAFAVKWQLYSGIHERLQLVFYFVDFSCEDFSMAALRRTLKLAGPINRPVRTSCLLIVRLFWLF